MADDLVQKPTRDRQFTAVFALCTTLTCCAVLVLATPRVLVPVSLPPLTLACAEVDQALAADARLAPQAPTGSDVVELEKSYREELLAERGPPLERRKVMFHHQELQKAAKAVFARIGPAGVKALRAQAIEHFMAGWNAATAAQKMNAPELGALPEQLRTYGVLDSEGELLAPELCLRVQVKARWNMIHNLPVSSDLLPVEVQAFEGWLALHAEAAPNDRRVQAARAFHAAGGHRGAEALAIWLHRIGQGRQALVYMQRAHLAHADLFTRNYALGLAGALL